MGQEETAHEAKGLGGVNLMINIAKTMNADFCG